MKTLWNILLAAIILLAAVWLLLFASNRSLAEKAARAQAGVTGGTAITETAGARK